MPLTLPVVKAESIGLLAALETTRGSAPASGFFPLQPDQGGITDFWAKIKTVAPSPLTSNRQMEAPQIVDLDAAPTIKQDLTADLMDTFGEGIVLAKTRHPGGTGLAYFVPTARTTTAYNVAMAGALQQGTIVVGQGWANPANNGQFVVGASSTATSISVPGGIAETPVGYLATLEVAGFRGASGDISLDVNGNLTSTVADFTTMGIPLNAMLWVGGTVGGGHDFATAAYRGFAKVVTVTPHLVTLARRAWTPGAADTGAGKTIDLYWGRYLRNVAATDPDFQEPSYTLELSYPFLETSGTATGYAYSYGNEVSQFKVDVPAQNLVKAEISFLGTTISDPTTTRTAGASLAPGPLGINRYNSVTTTIYRRIALQSDESTISDDIDTISLTWMNNITPQKQIGTLGNARTIWGKAQAMITATVFLTQDNAMKACTQNLTCTFGMGFRNNDGGIFFDVPSTKVTEAPTTFPANGPVTLALKLEAFRDAATNVTMGITLFPYLPVG